MQSIKRAVLIARFCLRLASQNRLIERTLETKSSRVKKKKKQRVRSIKSVLHQFTAQMYPITSRKNTFYHVVFSDLHFKCSLSFANKSLHNLIRFIYKYSWIVARRYLIMHNRNSADFSRFENAFHVIGLPDIIYEKSLTSFFSLLRNLLPKMRLYNRDTSIASVKTRRTRNHLHQIVIRICRNQHIVSIFSFNSLCQM